MTSHDRFLQLAAAAIDNPISAADRQRLAAHLAGCRVCTRDAAALRGDAAAFAELPLLGLSARRGEAILGAVLTPAASLRPMRLLLIAAALALLLVGTLAVGAQLVRRAEQLEVVPPAPSLVTGPSAPPVPSAAATPSAVAWTSIGSLPAPAGTIAGVAGFDGGYVAITSAGSEVWFSPDGRAWQSVALPISGSLRAQTHGVVGRGPTIVVTGSYRRTPCTDPVDRGSTSCPTTPISWASTDGRHWTIGDPVPLPAVSADHPQGGLLGPAYPTVTGGWDAIVAYWDDAGTVPTDLLHSDDGIAWAPVLDAYGTLVDVSTPAGSTTSIRRGGLPRTQGGDWLMPVTLGDLTANARATIELSADADRWLDEVQLPLPDGAYSSWAGEVIGTGDGFVAGGLYRVRTAGSQYTAHRLEWVSPDGRAWTIVAPLDTRELVGAGGPITDGPSGTIRLVGYANEPGETAVLLLR